MNLTERIFYSILCTILGGLIAMAVIHFTLAEETTSIYKTFMIPSGIGGLLFGKDFFTIISQIWDKLWHWR